MDLQAIFRFENILTLVALKSFLVTSPFNNFCQRNLFTLGGLNSWSFKFFPQKLGSSSGIPPQSRWSLLLVLLCFGGQSYLPPGVQGEGEAVSNSQGKGEGQRLAGQCLAKFQTLRQESSISFLHRGHFLRLYLNQKIIWSAIKCMLPLCQFFSVSILYSFLLLSNRFDKKICQDSYFGKSKPFIANSASSVDVQYWIVWRKHTEWVIRLWPLFRWTLNRCHNSTIEFSG